METSYLLDILFRILPFLIFIAPYVFVIYAILTSLNLMKQRNEYLKEIRNELKKSNGFN